MNENRCETCKWWQFPHPSPQDPGGVCREDSPKLIVMPVKQGNVMGPQGPMMILTPISTWPSTTKDDYCGKHCPKLKVA